jgi:hypothetical protein
MKRIPGLARAILAIVTVLFLPGCSTILSPADPSTPAISTEAPPGPPPGAEILAAGVWMCPEDLAGAMLIGSIEGDTYYWPDCGQARNIELEARICFATADAARAYGYRPCGTCP